MGYKTTCVFHKPFGDLASDEHACLYDGVCNCDNCTHEMDSRTALYVLRTSARKHEETSNDFNQLYLDYLDGKLCFNHYNGADLELGMSIAVLSYELQMY